jgi:hypothetical protein
LNNLETRWAENFLVMKGPALSRSPKLAALVARNSPPDHFVCLRQTASLTV